MCVCVGEISHPRTNTPPLLAACTCEEWWVSYQWKAAILKQLLDIRSSSILDLLDKLGETAGYAVSDEGGKCTWPHPFCLPTPDTPHFSSRSDITVLPPLLDWRFRAQIRHFTIKLVSGGSFISFKVINNISHLSGHQWRKVTCRDWVISLMKNISNHKIWQNSNFKMEIQLTRSFC